MQSLIETPIATDADGADPIPDEMTLTLRKPITLGTLTYEKLELTEPLAGDLIKAGKAGTDLEQLAELIRLNAKVPRGVVDQMTQRDLMAAAAFYAPFA